MGAGTSFAKILLIIFNIIFWLSGVALLGVGIWLLIDKQVVHYINIFRVIETSGELLQYAAYVFIVVGAFVLIVGFFGCCGAIKENRCMLGVYIVLLVLIMGLEIAAGVLAIIYKAKIIAKVDEKLGNGFTKFYGNNTDEGKAFTSGLKFAQAQLHCCGISGPVDYKTKRLEYDVSCCVLKPDVKTPIDTLNATDAKDFSACKTELASTGGSLSYHNGCVGALKTWVKSQSIILIGVGIGIACLELFGFIFAVCLCRSVGEEQ